MSIRIACSAGAIPFSLRNQQMEVVVLIGQLVVDLDTCLFIHDKCVCRYALKTNLTWYAIASSGTNVFNALIRYQAAF
jgi:hypothetical protein